MQRSPKRRKITDFFQKELPNTKQQETEPEQQVMPMFLRRYQPTSVPRRKGPVGRPRRQSQPDAVTESQPENSQEPEDTENNKPRGVYKSYSLRQNLEIVEFARENSERCHDPRFTGGRTLIRSQPQRKRYP